MGVICRGEEISDDILQFKPEVILMSDVVYYEEVSNVLLSVLLCVIVCTPTYSITYYLVLYRLLHDECCILIQWNLGLKDNFGITILFCVAVVLHRSKHFLTS